MDVQQLDSKLAPNSIIDEVNNSTCISDPTQISKTFANVKCIERGDKMTPESKITSEYDT